MADHPQAAFAATLAAELTRGALPAELADWSDVDRDEAARFLADTAMHRMPGTPAIAIEPIDRDTVRRRMRIAIVNDDMPFLVDSVAAALAARDLAIDRIIHPVVPAMRGADGMLEALLTGGRHESMIYIEADRADARERHTLHDALAAVLADVRSAVTDWPALQRALAADMDAVADAEARALLGWFLDGHLTLLSHARWTEAAGMGDPLGLARHDRDAPILAAASCALALRWFEEGGAVPLLVKSNLVSPVHRAVPLDLVVLPLRDDGRVMGLSIHAGLWTSAALAASPRDVPLLRARLAALEAKFAFDPRGHTGKALAHAIGSLPYDLAVGCDSAGLEQLALTAMSQPDRPRPALVLVRSPLGRHLFAFVWLPRDDVTTGRRLAIGDLIASAANGRLLNWTIALEDGGVALLRYMVDLRGGGDAPDAAALSARIADMVRGWNPAVETALAALVPPARAARLALRHAASFPAAYRNAFTAEEAAADTIRLADLATPADRSVRIDRSRGVTHLKIYRLGGALALSDAVPVLENFGFHVIEEMPVALTGDDRPYIHDFLVEADGAPGDDAVLEAAIAAVLAGTAENDGFNRLIVEAGLAPDAVLLLRAWFRYLRQAGLPYGLATVVDALRRAPAVAAGLIARFAAAHDPDARDDTAASEAAIASGLDAVTAIDDDRVLRAYRDLIRACLRTNAYAPARDEALAFKFDSALIPGLPAPVPWREMWVYSPRVEGIHLRAGPVARGGLRWSDRREDFRTEILGLMKAQRVKNAVIVPTGAKGGFYPKHLPPPANRDAWLAEGTESYRIFIRSLLSITDNIVDGVVVHPDRVVVHDGEDPYFVVAADKGTATFSDIANAIALDRGFWLGDAFASGGSNGYDHKAMGITAKGAWVSVQRHFAERGVDVQTQPITVVGCGDMSGDVFGNGMLLSQAIRLVAAFDHRHIFFDPDPDPATSWAERARLFALPRSSWADYAAPVSAGGGVHSRAAKSITLTPQVQAMLGVAKDEMEPAAVISAILRAPADLIWFGGIGTYVKAAGETDAQAGDPANDRLRVDAETVRAVAIGEGANLGVTQAARIAFSLRGGRINTDFIDNSAGVDCSDNEVNIKIALGAEVREGRLTADERNTLLAAMTDDVAHLVLEDNRLQTLALSIAEADGADAIPSYLRVIELFEASGRLDRRVEGLAGNDVLVRRGLDGAGLARPELAVLLSTAKLSLQDAIEGSGLGLATELEPMLLAAFPAAMRTRFADAIRAHRLRGEIVATKLANRIVNRLGFLYPFELAEEEGAALSDIAAMFVAAERLFGLDAIWQRIETAEMPEAARLALFDEAALATRSHIADLLRIAASGTLPGAVLDRIGRGVRALEGALGELLLDEARGQSARLSGRLADMGAPVDLVAAVVRLFELDGAVGLAALGVERGVDEALLTRAYTRLGSALGIDWAQHVAARLASTDPWERLLIAGLVRDFEQLRLTFLARAENTDPLGGVEAWLAANSARVAQFTQLVTRARAAAAPSPAMLAQIAGQARVLLAR